MRKLEKHEYTVVFTIDEALKVNGFYAEVDNDMHVKAMCIYMVKGGKLYDDISLDCGCKEWDVESLYELRSSSHKLARLTDDYSSVFNK